MLIDRWQEIESLYHSARERNPEERLAYLESACGADETLLREVESLLANDDLAAEFLETNHEAPRGRRERPFLRANGSDLM